MKVSIVITVLNENKSILPLLNSLKKQTLQPNEVIIVDGGSTDGTIANVETFILKVPNFPLRLIKESGNISHGRNVGIKFARNKVVALTDAGCVAKKDWLKKLTKPFEDKKVKVVAGFYEMKSTSALQKAVAPFHGVPPQKFDRYFMPSARSIAFRKSAWRKVGGFSESLIRAGEDTLFNYSLIKKHISITHAPEAVVEWEVPRTFSDTAKKFYFYAKGDAQTGIWWHPAKKFRTHNIKIMTIFARYLFLLLIVFLGFSSPFFWFVSILVFVLYTSWSIWKMRDQVIGTLALMIVPIIQILSDISVMLGFISGLLLKAKQGIIKK